jgi:undecaprenyl pyrophosphate synthase
MKSLKIIFNLFCFQDIDSIDEDLISATLQTNRGLPDPTILIRIGLSSSNLGFLPWQTRLTEIYDWPSLMTFTFQNFFRILQKFSKCEQRFGR